MEVDPTDLYIFQDGPRNNVDSDAMNCSQVRDAINNMTYSTKACVHSYYSDKNLGCGPGPTAAINWFFENVDHGIIIEDDAVPDSSFFTFAEDLLNKYKSDSSIRAIGSMHLDTKTYGDGSYYFSMMNRTLCAWATWKRAWQDFDYYHRNLTRKQLNSCLKKYGCPLRMREYWCDRLSEIQKDAYHDSSWDQQFWISIWINQGKGIMPNSNLCTNIGFDEYGTHTTDSNSSGANKVTVPITTITDPSSEQIIKKADINFQKIYFEPYQYGKEGFRRLPFRINKRIKRLVGHEGSWIKKKNDS